MYYGRLRNNCYLCWQINRILLMKRVVLLIIANFILAQTFLAQEPARRAFGVYSSTDRRPLEGVAVSLLSTADSTLRDVALTDAAGRALLPSDSLEHRILALSHPGMTPLSMIAATAPDSMFMTPTGTELKELTVTGSALTRKAGKLIFDPSTLGNHATNAREAVELTPLVYMDSEGGVKITGVGTSVIYINGRPPKMAPQALKNYLAAIPSGNIKSIEIITNPGSSYKASMTGGIVNVILRRPDEGTIFSLVEDGSWAENSLSSYTTAVAGYTKGHFSATAYALYGYYDRRNKTRTLYEYTDPALTVENTDRFKNISNSILGGLNGEFRPNSKSTIGVGLNLSGNQADDRSTVRSLSTGPDADPTESGMGINRRTPWTSPTIGVTSFYTLETDTLGSYLDVGADWSTMKARVNTDYLNDDELRRQETRTDMDGFNIRPTYRRAIGRRHSVRAGYDYSYGRIDNHENLYGQIDNFRYNEQVHAAFAEWNGKFGENLSVMLGLRVEHTRTTGRSADASLNFLRSYTDVFPSLSVSLNIPRGDQSISLDVSRDIFRPYFNRLNPYVYYTSGTTCRKGNPLLRSDKSWRASLYYGFLKDFTLVLNADYTPSDAVREYTYGKDGMTVSSFLNSGTQLFSQASLTYNRTFRDWLRVKLQGQINYYRETGDIGGGWMERSHISYCADINLSAVLSPRYMLRATAWLSANSPSEFFGYKFGWRNYLSLGLRKSFRCGLDISLTAGNILNTHNNTGHFRTPAYSYDIRTSYSQRSVELSVSYAFGNFRMRYADTRSSNVVKGRLNTK